MSWARISVSEVTKDPQETKRFSLGLGNNNNFASVRLYKCHWFTPLAETSSFIPAVIFANTTCRVQRGFGLLPVIGLTSTLMITWEVITSSVNTSSPATEPPTS